MSVSDLWNRDKYTLGTTVRSHLLTRVEDFDLAFPVERIVSVHEAPVVFPTPAVQPGILGAVNVRGQAIPVSDLRRSLRAQPKATEPDDRLIIVRSGGRDVGVIVDAVLTLVDIPRGVLEGPDPLFGDSPVNGQVITGVVAAPELCAVVDPDGLVLPDHWGDDEAAAIFNTGLTPDDPLAARTKSLAQPQAIDADMTGTDAAVFMLAGQRYAVPITSVVEFFSEASYAPLPIATGLSASLVNRRGEALPLYDVRPLLGISGPPLDAHVDGVVLSGNGFRVAIAVDSFQGLEVLPQAAQSATRPGRYTVSIHATPRGAIQLLDVAALTGAPQFSLSGEGSI